MKIRRTCVLMLALAALACGATESQAQKKASKGIKLGETFEGEMKGEKFAFYAGNLPPKAKFPDIELFKNYGGPKEAYFAEVPVALKAGDKLTITASVRGNERKLMIIVLDKTGEVVGHTDKFTAKSAELVIDEANVTGTYKIGIFSDKSGAYSLRARGGKASKDSKESGNEGELDEKALKAKIKALKKQLSDLEDKLEALQEKKSK